MKLRARAMGLAVGIVWGLTIFVATLWAVAQGRGTTLVLLQAFQDLRYIGELRQRWEEIKRLSQGIPLMQRVSIQPRSSQ